LKVVTQNTCNNLRCTSGSC